MNIEPEKWPDRENYIYYGEILSKIKIVNDVAEFVVALITQYNKCITKNEDKKQELLLVIQDHRQIIADTAKITISVIN